MSFPDGPYLSIENPVEYSLTIQRSKFIASLRVTQKRAEFESKMDEIIHLYPKATHYCWAYRFRGNPPTEHSSDSGEPSGAAGRPILGALKKHSLLNIMAVVTRYYGGVKLGVKGLIAAYGNVTLLAIESANIIETEPSSRIFFSCSYELYNLLLSRLTKNSISASDIDAQFSHLISGEINVLNSKLKAISAELDSLSPSGDSFSYSTEKI